MNSGSHIFSGPVWPQMHYSAIRRGKIIQHSVRTLFLLCGFWPTAVRAGQAAQPFVFQKDFQVCSTEVTSTEEQRLFREKARYEKRIQSLLAQAKTSSTVYSSGTTLEGTELRRAQSSLLQVLERLECTSLGKLNDAVVRGPSEPKPNFVELRVNYATDRLPNPETARTSNTDPTKYFTGILDPNFHDFSFGTLRITIPTRRAPGELSLPRSWNFVDQSDPARFFVIQQILPVSREAFMQVINAQDANEEGSLLLFVHGFDTTFADAAFRAAQLAHDLQFRGKVMFYSWPSAGVITGYWKDEDSSRISASRFQKLLADLLATKINRIYIVSHSMGSRIVIPSINGLASRGIDVSKLSELMLAAPDFNEIEFKDVAAGFRELRSKGTRLTIYASSNDFALRASKVIHSYRRLGESDPSLDIFPGLDSVDASPVAPIRRAFGHSYVYDSAEVIGDMEDIVLNGLAPKERGLLSLPDSDFGWKFPK
jgi:esterase/lipase superfamily enzyme